MRSTLTRSTLATAMVMTLALAVAGPAAATHNGEQPPAGCRWIRGTDTPEDHTDDVYVCRQNTWIHTTISADSKLGNLAGFGQGSLPSWDTRMPTEPMTSSSSGFYVTNSAFHQLVAPQDPRGSFVAQGTYTGVIDNVAVDLYAFVSPTYSQDLNLELVVDGEPILAATVVDVRNTTVGNLRRIRYAFTNLYDAMAQLGMSNQNETVHTLKLAANGVYIIDDPMVFAYDATEAPAGVVFNHDALTSAYTQLDPTAG